ncbi:MAG: hypothetical protein DRQ88_11465 [Epsilonproteobacteria bacterium]|nr:MAG: hypothetical protein DRQ88_11465 [Campylobacterota bacterium]RLA64940.1 MAG: hypothetical protein DRQ89_02645 [Campylobacterota bacterium]
MNSKHKVLIFDFNDSFTYNVACELYQLGIKTEVIAKENILETLEKVVADLKKCVLIYGPGPGHPDDYAELFPLMMRGLEHPNIFNFGICLGHQLLWRARGLKVIPSKFPIHGQEFKFNIPHWEEFEENLWGKKVDVQRYNSLVVESSDEQTFSFHQGEVMASRFDRGISFQFHPESVGTENPAIFFKSIKNFLTEQN